MNENNINFNIDENNKEVKEDINTEVKDDINTEVKDDISNENKIKFYDYKSSKYIILDYNENNSIFSYTNLLSKYNIKPIKVYFMRNFKIMNIYSRLDNNNDIVIIHKSFIKINSIKTSYISKDTNDDDTNNNTDNNKDNKENNEKTNEETNKENKENNENEIINNYVIKNTRQINLDKAANNFLCLLERYPDLISFIIILKTNITDYISLFLEKYRKKNIYNIIRNNQKEIIDMLENNKTFINMYIRTSNVNILQNIINYSYNNLIVSQLENVFPDVPVSYTHLTLPTTPYV